MKIFISHISEEQPLATVIKKWLEDTFLGNVTVFVSSDPDNISAGTKWLDEINEAMDCAKLLIILYSPQSKFRPWINFEAGCGWIKKIPIIPICHSGLKFSEIEAPISDFQGLDIESTDFTKRFFGAVTKHAGFTKAPRVSNEEFMKEAKTAIGCFEHKVIKGASTKKKDEISKEQIKIMNYLIEEKNSGMSSSIYGDGASESFLARECQLVIAMLSFHIDTLVDKRYVNQKEYENLGRVELFYSITPKGINYMVGNGLYKSK